MDNQPIGSTVPPATPIGTTGVPATSPVKITEGLPVMPTKKGVKLPVILAVSAVLVLGGGVGLWYMLTQMDKSNDTQESSEEESGGHITDKSNFCEGLIGISGRNTIDGPTEEGSFRYGLCGGFDIGIKIDDIGYTDGLGFTFWITSRNDTGSKSACLSSGNTLSLYKEGLVYSISKDPDVPHKKLGTRFRDDYFEDIYQYGVSIDVIRQEGLPNINNERLSVTQLYNDRSCTYVGYQGGDGVMLPDKLIELNSMGLGFLVVDYH